MTPACSAPLCLVAHLSACFTMPVPWARTARHLRRRHLASINNYAAKVGPMQTFVRSVALVLA
jgi:hypothetical protein